MLLIQLLIKNAADKNLIFKRNRSRVNLIDFYFMSGNRNLKNIKNLK